MTDERGLLPAGQVRASDADREKVLAELRQAFSDGRLNQDQLAARIGSVMEAEASADLVPLTRDLAPKPEVRYEYKHTTKYVPDWFARWTALVLFDLCCWMPLIAWNGTASSFWALSDLWPVIPVLGSIITVLAAMLMASRRSRSR